MSFRSIEVKVLPPDEEPDPISESAAATQRLIAEAQRLQAAAAEEPAEEIPYVDREPPDVVAVREAGRLEYDRLWQIEDDKDPAGGAAEKLAKQGRHREPPDASELFETDLREGEETRAEIRHRNELKRKTAGETHAKTLHQPKAHPTRRLRNPARPGVGGDKNVPKSIGEIDGQRIIR